MKRLIATGKQLGTSVYNDDGTAIQGLTAVTFRHRVKQAPVLELEILCKTVPTGDRKYAGTEDGRLVDVSVPKVVVYVADPQTGMVKPVRSIAFEDGTVWDKVAQKL